MKARAGPRVCRTAYFAYCRIGEVASSLTAGSLCALCNYPLASPEARILPKMATWHIRESPTIVHLAEGTAPLTRYSTGSKRQPNHAKHGNHDQDARRRGIGM